MSCKGIFETDEEILVNIYKAFYLKMEFIFFKKAHETFPQNKANTNE